MLEGVRGWYAFTWESLGITKDAQSSALAELLGVEQVLRHMTKTSVPLGRAHRVLVCALDASAACYSINKGR